MSNGSGVTLKYGNADFNVQTNLFATGPRRPVPLVTVDTTANADKDNNILSFRSTITLDGTVIGSGITFCMSGYSGLVNYFSDQSKQGQTFIINCDGAKIAEYPGTVFKTANASKSENNWVVTLPYTITLESVYPASGVSGLIESFEDSWNIEQLEEAYFFDYNRISPYYELGSNGTTINLDSPPSLTDLSASSASIGIRNILQYKISHRISAVGIAIDRTNISNPNPGGSANTSNLKSAAYMEASRWVSDRANLVFSQGQQVSTVQTTTTPTGIVINPFTASQQMSGPSILPSLRLYNHVRSIESNISAGSYSITDTWLALSSGVPFTEDFSFEISTDDRLNKTVTINGTVKGLETSPSGYTYLPKPPMTGNISHNFPTTGLLFPLNRFASAISGYQSGIKPYLYERASLALSAVDRPPSTGTSNAPAKWIGPPKWGRLNITPVSYTESLNPSAGTVTYNVVYNNKPGSWLSGVLSSVLTVNDSNPSDQVAETFVLGRPLGPILEKVGTTKSERRVSLEVVYPAPTGFNSSHPNSPQCVIYSGRPEYQQVKQLMESFRPISPVAFATIVPTSSYGVSLTGIVFKTSDSTTWNPFEGRFSWDITWVYNTGTCS